MCGGKVIVRKTKRKRKFYVCENNPDSCEYISWNKPKKGEKWIKSQNEKKLDEKAKNKKINEKK